ncbi:nuclear transport factor 2 family protein [Dactylosporangium sp. CA-139066]|uniref:nuclear transport factor 2 family protein n=1 Tax=Dactylosporangium sp. CA-139066 TaxID=3239930 RepID=UPI003D8C25B6
MTTPQPDQLALLVDRMAVQDVLVRYATALDSRDWQLLRTCFTPDAVGVYETLGEQHGYERIEALCRGALEPLAATQHIITNIVVELAGDRARTSCYLQSMHVRERPDGDNFIVAGQYRDELVRTADGWRIARRNLRRIWTQGRLGDHGRSAGSAGPSSPSPSNQE